MKKHLLALSAAAVLLAPNAVGAEGFAINEWSAEGFGMAGARMFAENDAANMAYNPASLTKVQGEKIKATIAYISPHGKWDATGINQKPYSGHNRVNPAFVPGLYYTKQLNDNEWLGMGTYVRFGNMCQFERDSMVASNAFSSRLNGCSLGLNYARKHNEKWSTSLGAEINYVGLQYDKNLGSPFYSSPVHLEGTSWALGWNAAANYAFDDKNEFGVVFRSKVKHSMEANYDAHGFQNVAGTDKVPNDISGDAYGVVTLPESWMLGYGHKFNDKTRMELNATWTRWSRLDSLDIAMDGFMAPGLIPNKKDWNDGWRYAIGIEHKLSDKYTLLAGMSHDERGIPDEYADFMVPTGERDTYTLGVQYHDKKQTIAASFGYMDVGDLDMQNHGKETYANAKMHDSYTKIVVLSYQYNF